ncbi:HAD family hydrolase [Salipaludibacillus daqingensis]|uniref:HAD family hydrolase n=1 Tax=Salipaludibacillus daqingensis TaxID=3041001 RepID=UPI002472EB71|nr:HAD family hydrolase [Salipaludibacillus daqingensis]
MEKKGLVTVETIIFDVDDTLYDQTVPFRNAFRKLFHVPFTDEKIEEIYIASRKYCDALFEKSQTGEIPLLDMQIYRLTAACQEFDLPVSDQKAMEFQKVYVEEQQKIKLFDEMEELLDLLSRRNKQLAVLTNGEEEHQSMKIKQLNLANWIPEKHFFISGKIGHAKPTKRAFQFIEDELSLDRSKTVYIGDSFENDIVGAKQAGWHAIWMNHRNRKQSVESVHPDKIVSHPKELLDVFSSFVPPL